MKIPRRTSLLLIMLGIALLASLLLNLVLGTYTRRFYDTVSLVRLDPLGLETFPTQEAAMSADSPHTRVALVGDSRAEDWIAPASLTDFQFINRGIGGHTSAQVLGRFDAHIAPLTPEIVVIQVGINDLAAISQFPHRRQTIVENCKKNILHLVDKSLEIHAAVILTTIFPHGPITFDRSFFWSDAVDVETQAMNALVRSQASERVWILDADLVLRDTRGLVRPEYSRDFLHLNEAGYAALNEELARLLVQVVNRR